MWTAESRAFVGDFGAGQALSDEQYALLAPLIPHECSSYLLHPFSVLVVYC